MVQLQHERVPIVRLQPRDHLGVGISNGQNQRSGVSVGSGVRDLRKKTHFVT
jgi:hypothetical protein